MEGGIFQSACSSELAERGGLCITGTGGAPTYTYGTEGTFDVTLTATSANGCEDAITIPITVHPNPVANFSAPDVCVNGDPTLFNDLSTISGGTITSWSWDFGDGSTPLPYSISNSSETHTYNEGGTFTVTLVVKNAGPCFDTLTRELCVSEIPFFIADIFSPNGDGANDILYVRSSEAEKIEFLVFDRWGNLLFESDDVNIGWDGTYKGRKAEEGVYFYSIKMTLSSGEEVLEKGDITLIR